MMSKKEYFVVVVSLIICLLAGCGVEDRALVLTPRDTVDSTAADDKAMSDGGARETLLYVHVCGAVVSPGVVELPEGSRAEDALLAAGGFTEDARTDYVNLASRVEDGQQLYFPTEEEAEELGQTAKEQEQAQQLAQSGMVNINTADLALLCTLPGIGETRAQDIIDYREQHGAFAKIEDIMQVPGIKDNAFAKICDKIVVD